MGKMSRIHRHIIVNLMFNCKYTWKSFRNMVKYNIITDKMGCLYAEKSKGYIYRLRNHIYA